MGFMIGEFKDRRHDEVLRCQFLVSAILMVPLNNDINKNSNNDNNTNDGTPGRPQHQHQLLTVSSKLKGSQCNFPISEVSYQMISPLNYSSPQK